MKLTEQEKQSIIDYYRYQRNCTPFVFPSEMNPYIKKYCIENDILVFYVPVDDWFPDIVKVNLQVSGADWTKRSVLVRPYKYDNVKAMEFGIWHEIGHIMNQKHFSESMADNFAIDRLTELYDNEGMKIYMRWLFKHQNVDRKTGEFERDPDIRYEHRNKFIEWCIKQGLDKFTDCFE